MASTNQSVNNEFLYGPLISNTCWMLAIVGGVIRLHGYFDPYLFVEPLYTGWSGLLPLLIVAFGAGILCYPLTEYPVHRWLLHGTVSWLKIFRSRHIQHHIDFKDAISYKTRDLKKLKNVVTDIKVFLAVFIPYYTVAALVVYLLDLPGLVAVALCMGVTFGFFWFNFEHYGMHIEASPINTKFLRTPESMFEHHYGHHFKARCNFAVSAPLLDDWVFKTSLSEPED